jgi:hypothetical protein
MKSSRNAGLSSVALQILAYLKTHRNAQDTTEGIAEWWLIEQRTRRVIPVVRRALAELEARGLVLKGTGRDGRARYRLGPRKRRTVTARLGNGP